MGNGLTETDTTNVRLQTTSIQVGNLMTLGFNYGTTNNNGNLQSQTITRAGQSQPLAQSYAYDTLNRVACANENPSNPISCAAGTGNWSRTFGYDPWGNGFVTYPATGLNSFTPVAPTNFNGFNQMTYQGATYDGAGNQKTIGGYMFTYDAENRLISSTIGSSATSYVYDGDGHRVMKSTGTSATTYVYDAAGLLVAEYGTPSAADTGTRYVSTDHLGSTRLVTDTSQNQVICFDYQPFGELIPTGTDGRSGCYGSMATPLTQKFTSMERDQETNNDFFQARYMSAFQ